MKVLFISTKPASLNSGAEVRNFHLLKALDASNGITSVDFVLIPINEHHGNTNHDSFSDKINFTRIPLPKRVLWKSFVHYFSGKIPYAEHLIENSFHASLLEMNNNSDVVIFSELDGYLASKKTIEKCSKRARLILDCHNVDFIRFSSELDSGHLIKRMLGDRLKNKMKLLEIEALRAMDKVFACSTVDKAYFEKFISKKKISIIPNGVSILPRIVSHEKSPSLLFIGDLSYQPNRDAIRFFLYEVRPLLQAKYQSTTIRVIGRNPPDWLMQETQRSRNLEVLGFIENLSDILFKSTICICPIRFGSGTRLKILEYLGAQKPVISTSKGAEGIDVRNNESILLADTAIDFAKSIDRLLSDPTFSQQIAFEGFKLVSRKYTWDIIGKAFIAQL